MTREEYTYFQVGTIINFYILIWQRYNQKVSYSNYMSKRLF